MKKLSIEDIDFEFIPASVLQDVDKRIADWRAAGGEDNDQYIQQQLREAMTELRKTPKSRGKIEAVERELRNRGNKNKKTKFFPIALAEKRFAREWTKACGRIRGRDW